MKYWINAGFALFLTLISIFINNYCDYDILTATILFYVILGRLEK